MASQSELWDWWHHVSKVDYGIDVLTFQNELWDLWHHSVEVDCGIDNIYTIVLRLYNFRLDSIMLLCWIVGSMTSRCWSGLWDWQHRHHCAEAYLFQIDSFTLLWWIVRLMTIMSARRIEGLTCYTVLVNCGIDGITLLNWIVGLTPSCWGFISFVLTVSLFCGELTSSHCWGGLNSHKGVMIGKWSMWHHLDNKVDVSKVNRTAGWIYMHSDDIRLQLTVIKKESIKTRHRSLATGRIL